MFSGIIIAVLMFYGFVFVMCKAAARGDRQARSAEAFRQRQIDDELAEMIRSAQRIDGGDR